MEGMTKDDATPELEITRDEIQERASQVAEVAADRIDWKRRGLLGSLKLWWSRPCGGKAVMQIAWPLIISTASWTLMHFVDRVFLVWYSKEAFAASLPAGMLHYSMLCFPLGVAGYVNTFVAQYHGAGRPERVGRVVWQGVILGLFSVPVFLATIPFSTACFRAIGHDPAVQVQEVEYYNALALGGGGAVIATALASFFTGLGKSRVVMIVDTSGAAFNILFDYLWIFGNGGFPEWGIWGGGLATSIGQWLKVVLYLAILCQREFRVVYRLRECIGWDGPLLKRLLVFGGPSGVQQFVEMTSFTLFLFLLGMLGTEPLAATNIAFSVNSLAFLPLMGMGIAVSTLVGHQLGSKRPELAERATWTSFSLALVYTGFMGALYLLVPDLFLWAHAAGSGEDFESLRVTTHILLRFVAAYLLFDATHIVFISAIKGAGDTPFVLFATLIIAPSLVVLTWFGLKHWNWGLYSFWVVITGWICVLGIVYCLRFLFGPWRSMRVIEH